MLRRRNATAWLLALTVLAGSWTASASRRRLPARAADSALSRPASPPPPPPVALQLTGLQITIPVSRSAIVHALTRDAWPALVQCVTPPPRVRGYATVRVHETEAGLRIDVVGVPTARDRELSRCVRRAIGNLELPPYEDARPETSIAFDLVFGLPSVGTARSAHARARTIRRSPRTTP